MKGIEELKDMTWWEITVNEGALTQLVLGIILLVLSVMYLVLDAYYWIKWQVIRRII